MTSLNTNSNTSSTWRERERVMESHGFLVVFLLFALLALVCDGSVEIPLGSQLVARENRSWVSENGTFAFGFAATGSADDQFLLAIWYAQLPGDPTIVWSPNRDSTVGRNGTITLDNNGNLVLTDGKISVWTSNTSSKGVQFALMSDTGNFILYNGSNSAIRQPTWQSFGHPSDTLLPGQPLSVSSELTSSRSSLGYYALQMLQQHTSLSLALTYVSPEVDDSWPGSHANYSYWSSPQISNATGDVVAILDQSGSFSIMYGESSAGTVYVHKNETGASPSILRRITVGVDGNLRIYSWDSRGSSQWVTEWSAVSNLCKVAGICGNGICNLDGSDSGASCTCLPGTSQASLNATGCSSSLAPPPVGRNCSGYKRMELIPQVNYYFLGTSTLANYSDVSTDSECSERCLLDCECVAAVYRLVEENTYCSTLSDMVFGGLQDPSSTFFVKVGSNGSRGGRSDDTSSADHHRYQLILPLVFCISALVVLLILLIGYSIKKRRKQQRQRMIVKSLSLPGAPIYISYNELQNATWNFSRLLGTGAFGSVYKGSLKDGTLVAVKKLERVLPHGEKEFVTEVTTIGSMHHMNLVNLYGFCSERTHRLLVYEYMSNGSLDKWIFPSSSTEDRFLDWQTRFQVAVAIAQGIAYFHEQCRNRIIHCDIKPENILLDEDFCPKVSDFGLAKLMSREHSQVVTMVRGTRGYLAPEWVSNRPITVKADVYSYGMLLLEIIGGRRNLDMSLDEEDYYYPGWAFKELMNGSPKKAVDRRLEGRVEEEELQRALSTAFWCIQEDSWLRPSMGEVVKMLEGSIEINVPPMPQTVLELMEEGLHSVYKAMKGDWFTMTSSSMINSQRSSRATCSYSTMSPR